MAYENVIGEANFRIETKKSTRVGRWEGGGMKLKMKTKDIP